MVAVYSMMVLHLKSNSLKDPPLVVYSQMPLAYIGVYLESQRVRHLYTLLSPPKPTLVYNHYAKSTSLIGVAIYAFAFPPLLSPYSQIKMFVSNFGTINNM